MKLNLNFNLLGIDEQELPDSNAGKIIAQCLANDTDGRLPKILGMGNKIK